jgi:LacI family transcriptional regulator
VTEKPVSIRDVARSAGVSPATVSNVLGGRKPVNKELADRVRKAALDLNYQVDRVASQLRTGKTRVIAVLVPDLNNPFFTSIVAAVEGCVRDEGYEIIVASSNGEGAVERSRLAAILAWRLAGLVVVPCSDAFPNRSLIERTKIPYVIADRVTDGLAADTVSVDNEEAGAVAALHFIERGHARILIAASVLQLANIRERCAGAAKVLRRHGLPAPDVVELGYDLDIASERLSRWFDRHERPTAVLALTNFTTLAVLATVAERRLAIPQQVSLIGFDDYEWMRARATPLTAIRQPVREMGKAIWERLSARMDGDGSAPRRVRLSCELMVRSSTAGLAEAGTLPPRSAAADAGVAGAFAGVLPPTRPTITGSPDAALGRGREGFADVGAVCKTHGP